MTKELKRLNRSSADEEVDKTVDDTTEPDVTQPNNGVPVVNNEVVDEEEDEDELDDEMSFKYAFTDEQLAEAMDRLKEEGRLPDSYDDFLKSTSNESMFIEKNNDDTHTVYLRSKTPQDAMDRLHNIGLINKDDTQLFKSFYNDLRESGVPTQDIKGGDLRLIRDDGIRDAYKNRLLEAFHPDGKKAVDTQFSANQGNDRQGPSDEYLINKLREIQAHHGLPQIEPLSASRHSFVDGTKNTMFDDVLKERALLDEENRRKLDEALRLATGDEGQQAPRSFGYEWIDDFMDKMKEKLKGEGRLSDSYNDFLKSKSKDDMFIEKNADNSHTVHLRATSPQEAMDKLRDTGFISKEDAETFKAFYDDLEKSGADMSKIKGGDLSLIRDERYRDLYKEQLLDAYHPDGKNRVREVDKPDKQAYSEKPGLSDAELLAKLRDVERQHGLNQTGPDVTIGRRKDTGPELEV